MIDWFKFSLLLLYIILIVLLAVAIAFSKKAREFLSKIHASPSDPNSWLRYACSVLLLGGIGMAIHNTIYGDGIDALVIAIIGIAITGKVTASAINKDK